MNLEKQLLIACKNGDLEKVKSLITLGVDIHTEHDGALCLAASNGHLKTVKYLVKNGANIHINNDEALRRASFNGKLKIVKYLIEKGADIHAGKDEALRISIENSHSEVVNYLFSLYKNKEDIFKTILKKTFMKDNLSVVKNIIDNYDLKLDEDFFKYIKNKHPSIFNYIKLIKEIELTKNDINFNIE